MQTPLSNGNKKLFYKKKRTEKLRTIVRVSLRGIESVEQSKNYREIKHNMRIYFLLLTKTNRKELAVFLRITTEARK